MMYEMLHGWEMRGKGGWEWQVKDQRITILYNKWDCIKMFESHAANSSVLQQMWVMVLWKLTIIPAKNWLLPLFFSSCWLTAKTAHWMWIYIPSSCFWRIFLKEIYMDCCSSLRSDFRKELLPRGSCLDHSQYFVVNKMMRKKKRKSKSVNTFKRCCHDFIEHKSGPPGERLVVIWHVPLYYGMVLYIVIILLMLLSNFQFPLVLSKWYQTNQ